MFLHYIVIIQRFSDLAITSTDFEPGIGDNDFITEGRIYDSVLQVILVKFLFDQLQRFQFRPMLTMKPMLMCLCLQWDALHCSLPGMS